MNIDPVENPQCVEGGLERLISTIVVRFSPAVTGGILRPFPRRMY
jgi:hypothetical protein